MVVTRQASAREAALDHSTSNSSSTSTSTESSQFEEPNRSEQGRFASSPRGVPHWVQKKFLQEAEKRGGLNCAVVREVCNTDLKVFGSPNSYTRRQIQNRVNVLKGLPESEYYSFLEELDVKSFAQLERERLRQEKLERQRKSRDHRCDSHQQKIQSNHLGGFLPDLVHSSPQHPAGNSGAHRTSHRPSVASSPQLPTSSFASPPKSAPPSRPKPTFAAKQSPVFATRDAPILTSPSRMMALHHRVPFFLSQFTTEVQGDPTIDPQTRAVILGMFCSGLECACVSFKLCCSFLLFADTRPLSSASNLRKPIR
jgi:hypothetical protein